MLVSVIIPAKNRQGTLLRAAQSALDQAGVEVELIIVDDGSTDGTLEVAHLIKSKHPSTIILSNSHNIGAPASRNKGAELASGEFISFLDSDDMWLPGKLYAQINAFQERPQISAVFCNVRYMYSPQHTTISKIAQNISLSDLFERNAIGGTSSVLLRPGVFKDVGGFSIDMPSCQDWDLWLRLAKLADLYVVPQVFVEYHFDGGGRISKNLRNVLEGHRKIFKQVNQLIPDDKRRRQVSALQDCRLGEVYAKQFGKYGAASLCVASAVIKSPTAEVLSSAARSLLRIAISSVRYR